MKAIKLLFVGLLSLLSCTENNEHHCTIDISKCSGRNMICNDATGQCEAPLPPLAVISASPSLLPSINDTQSKVVTINGRGFKSAGIKSVRIDGQELAATIISDSELTVDVTRLLSIQKCGPLDVEIVDANNKITKAPAEIFGRKYHQWTYSNNNTPAELVQKTLSDFSVKKFDGNPIEISYTDVNGVSVFAIGVSLNILKASGAAGSYRKIFRSSFTDTDVAGSFPVYITNESDSLIKTFSFSVANLFGASACDPGYSLVDYALFKSALNPEMLIACQSTASQSPIKNYVTFRALYSNAKGLSQKGSLNPPMQSFIMHSMSFPSNSEGLGALIVRTGTTSEFALKTIADFGGAISFSAGQPIVGIAPSVYSVAKSTAQSKLIRHYVASNVNDTVAIQTFDGSASATNEGVDGASSVLQSILPASFSGINSDMPVIELIDINCDQRSDIILKLDNLIVAYLAISESQWDWSAGPKILYRNDGQSSNIKKHELWIPSYIDAANQPGPTAALGVLNADGNFRLYRQE